MGTPNKQNNLLVKTPKYSIFPISSDHKLTMSLGRVYPVGPGYEMFPGDEIDINLQQLTRFLPMLSPVMQRYILDYIPVFVPFRLLWSEDAPIFNSNKFFNPATPDSERPAIPMTSWKQIFSNTSGKVIGSIFDYLGYPTQTGLYNSFIGKRVNFGTAGQPVWKPFEAIFDFANVDADFRVQFDYLASSKSFAFMGNNAASAMNFFHWVSVTLTNGNVTPSAYSSLEDFISAIPGDIKLQQLKDQYVNYMFNTISIGLTTANSHDLSLLPWLCYNKAYADWFLRSDLQDPDSFMLAIQNITSLLSSNNTTTLSSYTGYSSLPLINMIKSGLPYYRMWMDDYFTTANSGLGDESVPIPVTGSITSFWEANRLEQFRLRRQLSGKRFIDQIRQLFGVKVPDARLQRTEVLGHLKFNLVVSDVLQTSQSEIDSSLGSFAGQAISSNGAHLLHYKADEPGMIMILCSVRPTTSYVEHTHRFIFKKDYYDFENPMFDNVGMQEIKNNELCYRPGNDSAFGFTPRRYAEYMVGHSSIAGDFKTTLDYWHSARKFDLTSGVPGLNATFALITPEDATDRIFASQIGDNIVSQVYLDARVTRPLSRYVNYHM